MQATAGILSKTSLLTVEVGTLGRKKLPTHCLRPVFGRAFHAFGGSAIAATPIQYISAVGSAEATLAGSWLGDVSTTSEWSVVGYAPAKPQSEVRRPRETEWAWRRANEDLLRRNYMNQWVALEGQEIIASGPDPAEVVAQARRRGFRVPYVFQVMAADEGVSWAGL